MQRNHNCKNRWSLVSIWIRHRTSLLGNTILAVYSLCLYSKPSDKTGIKVSCNSLHPSFSFEMNGWEWVTLANTEEWAKKAKRIEFWVAKGVVNHLPPFCGLSNSLRSIPTTSSSILILLVLANRSSFANARTSFCYCQSFLSLHWSWF